MPRSSVTGSPSQFLSSRGVVESLAVGVVHQATQTLSVVVFGELGPRRFAPRVHQSEDERVVPEHLHDERGMGV